MLVEKQMICVHLDKDGLIARVIYLVLKIWVNKALLDPLTKVINLLIFIHILCNVKLHTALLGLRTYYQPNIFLIIFIKWLIEQQICYLLSNTCWIILVKNDNVGNLFVLENYCFEFKKGLIRNVNIFRLGNKECEIWFV